MWELPRTIPVAVLAAKNRGLILKNTQLRVDFGAFSCFTWGVPFAILGDTAAVPDDTFRTTLFLATFFIFDFVSCFELVAIVAAV